MQWATVQFHKTSSGCLATNKGFQYTKGNIPVPKWKLGGIVKTGQSKSQKYQGKHQVLNLHIHELGLKMELSELQGVCLPPPIQLCCNCRTQLSLKQAPLQVCIFPPSIFCSPASLLSCSFCCSQVLLLQLHVLS